MRVSLVLALLAIAAPAAAQTASAPAYDPAPWWMERSVIPSIGHVWTEVPANRAHIHATYEAIDRDSATAQRQAADKVRALGRALAAYGADQVRVETTFRIQPLYEQYRDRQGGVNENQRADKVDRYQVVANVAVEIRDARLTERVYATMMAARPASTHPVSFRLEPDNEMRTQMARHAVEDARRRALLSVEAAGAKLGAVRLIDPTARACETDVLLVGAHPGYGDVGAYRVAPPRGRAVGAPPPPSAPPPPPPPPPGQVVEDITVTGSGGGRESGLNIDVQLPLQPPLQRLEQRACVVYSLG